MEAIDLKDAVKARYTEVAEGTACCGPLGGCTANAEGLALAFGYALPTTWRPPAGRGESRPLVRQPAGPRRAGDGPSGPGLGQRRRVRCPARRPQGRADR